MPHAAWISNNIEIMKKDFHSAREERESQKFYDLMDYDQNLKNVNEITLFLRSCFGILLDPSILSVKYDRDTETIFIVRESKYNALDRMNSTIVETYSPQTYEDLDFDTYGNKEDFCVFMQENIRVLGDIIDFITYAPIKFANSFGYDENLVNEFFRLTPEFISFLDLFGNNAKAYKWYYEKYNFLELESRWHNEEHPFFTILQDIKLIANAYEPVIKNKLSNAVIKSLKDSPSFHINEDDAPQNGWELIGYLASTIGFESALSDVENKVWEGFKTLEEVNQLLLHYYIFQYQSFDLRIDEKMTDIIDFTYEDLQTYLRNIAQEIASQAYSEWIDSHEP